MDRFLPLDVTLQTLGAHLYPDEHILTHADSVGLYDGKDKSPRHADGRAILTSHRVVFVSSSRPHANSAYLPLSLVRQTEYWVGFLKSSPKITLLLAERSTSSSGAASEGTAAGGGGAAGDRDGERERDKTREALALAALAGERNWVCRVCGMHNVPTAQLGLKCSLCGVTRDPTPSSSSSPRPPPPPAASSAPPSRFGTPPPPPRPPRPDAHPAPKPAPPAALDPTETGARLACPVCTFLNHHSMTRCEVCDSVLLPPSSPPPPSTSLAHSAPHSRSNSLRSLAPSRSGTPGPGTDPASAAPVSVPVAGSASGATTQAQAFVRLSFRKGGEKAFYAGLKEAMGAKAWDLSAAAAVPGAGKGGKGARNGKGVEGKGGEGESEGGRGVGIDAILRGVDLDARDREDSLDDALKDLESLMRKAKNMITLAQSINAQLASSAASPSNGSSASPAPAAAARAASLASSSLHSLGLATPSSSVLDSAVTPDLVADDRAYHAELARELAGVLEKGRVMERKGGIVGLDEVWCLWNRARGVALVSPKDLRLAAPFLPTLPTASPAARLTLRVFHPSGLTILHTPRFAPRAFESRVLDLLDTRQALVASLALGAPEREQEGDDGGGASAAAAAEAAEREGASLLDIAHAEGLSVELAKELLGVLELGERAGAGGGAGASAGGAVVRDEQAGEGTRWYRNWISGAVWDGQEF